MGASIGGAEGVSKELNDDQLAAFDVEYVRGAMWDALRARIAAAYPGGRFRFVDVGGGNGVLADRILEAFPQATGVVLDRSELLIRRNRRDPRKALVCEPVERIPEVFEPGSFDLVLVNWLLHHLVHPDLAATHAAQRTTLDHARGLLAPGGRVSIFENLYDGAVVDDLPGRLIFGVTSSGALAPLARRLGANTAGCGVRFKSARAWGRSIGEAGLVVEAVTEDAPWHLPLPIRLGLQLRAPRTGHFWCRAA